MHAFVNKRVSVLLLLGMFLVVWMSSSGGADDRLWRKDFSELYSDQVRTSVDKGLAWLAAKQNDDGSWTSVVGYKINQQVEGERHHNVGVTAIAGLAYLSAGHFPNRGKYAKVVDGALSFIVDHSDEETGYISHQGTRMYEHGFATLFLAEIYGMTGNEQVRKALDRAVKLIQYAQNPEGGWRYQPTPKDADISVTVTVLQSLRAAQNVGIQVPKSVVDKAMHYIKRCYRGRGRFMYQAGKMSRSSWALVAAGIVSLQSAGKYDSKMVKHGVQLLWRKIRRRQRIKYGNYHYFYGHYYASQALYQSGWQNFKSYYKRFAREVVANQHQEGYWKDAVSPTYATSMACLILQLPVRYLPIFQK